MTNDHPPERSRTSLLRRARESVARRVWAGLTLEIGVVMLGVLLAFQVDQWGQTRDESRREHQLLERLWLETGKALEETSAAIGLHQSVLEQLGEVLTTEDPQSLAGYSSRPGFGCAVGSMPSLGFSETFYQEIVATGQLSLVRDHGLQNAMRTLVAAQAIEQSQLSYARSLVPPIVQSMDRYYRLSLNDKHRLNCVIDWTGAMRDAAAVNAMVRAHRNHAVILEARQNVSRALQRVHADIACKLSKQDCVSSE